MKPNAGLYNEQIAKVINISSNYRRHYDNLNHIKPVVPFSDHKHQQKILKLSTEKNRYTQNVRKLKLDSLQRENDSIIKRIGRTNSAVK